MPFLPFLAGGVVLSGFAQLGAMSVKISILTLSLQIMAMALIAVVIAAIVLVLRGRHVDAK